MIEYHQAIPVRAIRREEKLPGLEETDDFTVPDAKDMDRYWAYFTGRGINARIA